MMMMMMSAIDKRLLLFIPSRILVLESFTFWVKVSRIFVGPWNDLHTGNGFLACFCLSSSSERGNLYKSMAMPSSI